MCNFSKYKLYWQIFNSSLALANNIDYGSPSIKSKGAKSIYEINILQNRDNFPNTFSGNLFSLELNARLNDSICKLKTQNKKASAVNCNGKLLNRKLWQIVQA